HRAGNEVALRRRRLDGLISACQGRREYQQGGKKLVHRNLGSTARLENTQEVHEIGLLLRRELHVVAFVVEIDDGCEILGGAVGEIRCASGDTAQRLHDERPHIGATTGDQGATRIVRQYFAPEVRMRKRILVAGDLEQREL